MKVMNKVKIRIPFVFLLMLITVFLLPSKVMAKNEETTNVIGFNYSIDYPETQVNGQKGFFDLLLEPGAEQTVSLTLSNPSNDEVTVNVSANSTKTNSNGVIEYGPIQIEKDDSLKFDFEEIVTVPESVELGAGEVKKVELNIKMPATSFEGMVLGGIQLKKANQEEAAENTQGATVRNEYAYIVAMKIGNSTDAVSPEIKINKAYASQKNYRNSINVNMSNITASLNNDNMTIETQIMKKGSAEVLYERKQAAMSFAPNTQIDFPVSMSGEAMVPGDYTADVLVTIGERVWKESLEFKITKEEADTFNKRDVGLVQDRGLDWKLIGLIVGAVLVVVIVLFVLVKLVQKKQQAKKSSKKSSKRKSSSSKKKR